MYSTLAVKDSKHAGNIIGTHQKLDRIARKQLGKFISRETYFPSEKDILYFEGMKGPDGLKKKSPGVDEPMHFLIPEDDDGTLIKYMLDHQYNLRKALKDKNDVRAAFEAAWLAHVITDGLTPAHHFPLSRAQSELMTEKEFVKVFGQPVKGIMHGRNWAETLRNNWLYWGSNGYMSKHVAFEYGVAITMTALPDRVFTPDLSPEDLKNVNLKAAFYASLQKITQLDMYTRFSKKGWTTDLAFETKNILLPEIARVITLAWASVLPVFNSNKPATTPKSPKPHKPSAPKKSHSPHVK